MASRVKNGAVRTSASQTIRFEEMGHGEPAVLFLHGLFGSPSHWLPIMRDLASQYRVVAPQFPVDHHPNRRDSGMQSISDLTDYVELIIEELGLHQVVVGGNSLGGLVAIDYCLRNPDRSEGLVLTGSAGLFENNLAGNWRRKMTKEYIRARVCEILYNEELATDELVDGIHQDFLDRNYVRFIVRVARATRNHTVKDELARLKLPTLIVWGKNDTITPPEVAEEFRDRIENSQLVYIDHCGHSPNLEHPQEFSRILQEFLAYSLPARTSIA